MLKRLSDAVDLDVHREDQGHTVALLRDGRVMAAVTADGVPGAGCTVTRLGSMRYRPMAPAAFVDRWCAGGVTAAALAAAPVVVFDRKDTMQHDYLRHRGVDVARPPVHHVPASDGGSTSSCTGRSGGCAHRPWTGWPPPSSPPRAGRSTSHVRR